MNEFQEHTYPRGHVLWEIGEEGSACHFVARGLVQVYGGGSALGVVTAGGPVADASDSSDGPVPGEQVEGVGPGTLLGELSMLTDSLHGSHAVVARDETVLWSLARDRLEGLRELSPECVAALTDIALAGAVLSSRRRVSLVDVGGV